MRPDPLATLIFDTIVIAMGVGAIAHLFLAAIGGLT